MTPTRFRAELQAFDPKLDIEYNGKAGQWQIVGVDRRGIKYLIKVIPLGQIDKLGPWVLQELYECSPHKQGGRELSHRLDMMRDEEEAQQEREMKSRVEAATAEAWEALQRRQGLRINNVGLPFAVNDKRRFTETSVSAEAGKTKGQPKEV